jgi:hypothetical protein
VRADAGAPPVRKYIVHLDNWSQIPALNSQRTALPFRAAVRDAERTLRSGTQTDVARLYEPSAGWLRPEDAALSLRLGPSGETIIERKP